MELDDLKSGWGVLSERLMQNEILNKQIIREMVANRTNSAHSRLFRLEMFNVILIAAMCVVIPLIWMNTNMTDGTFILLETVMFLTFIVQVYIFSFLLRFNMETKNLYELTRLTMQYKIWVKRNYTYGVAVGILTIIGCLILQKGNIAHDAWRYIVIVGILVIAGFVGYIQIRFYNKNIAAMEKGLKELEEFEKE